MTAAISNQNRVDEFLERVHAFDQKVATFQERLHETLREYHLTFETPTNQISSEAVQTPDEREIIEHASEPALGDTQKITADDVDLDALLGDIDLDEMSL